MQHETTLTKSDTANPASKIFLTGSNESNAKVASKEMRSIDAENATNVDSSLKSSVSSAKSTPTLSESVHQAEETRQVISNYS